MRYRIAFLITIIVHSILFLLLTQIYWPDYKKVGAQQVTSIQSYIYAPHRNEEQHSIHASVKILKQGTNTIYHHVQHQTIPTHSHRTKIAVKNSTAANLTQGQFNKLLILLHNAIAKNQIYPPQAQLLQQQGIVKLRFILHSSGEITNIVIQESSGFNLLDNAAVAAVQKTSPFTAKKIATNHTLQLDINFDN